MANKNSPSWYLPAFQMVPSVFTTSGTWQQIIAANPRRWSIQFVLMNSASQAFLWPIANTQNAGYRLSTSLADLSLLFEFSKQPVLTTGAWWVFTTLALPIGIIEEVYTQ